MKKAIIVDKCNITPLYDQLLALLIALGIEIVDASAALDINADNDDIIVIVILCDASAADSSVNDLISSAAAKGCRIVGVWPENPSGNPLPPSLEKYGSSALPWNAEKLTEVLNNNATIWEDTVGAPRTEPITDRNKC